MEYINFLEDTYGSDSNNREPLGLLLAQNKVTSILKASGYKTGAFQTDDFYTEFRDANVYIKPTADQIRQYQNIWSLNSFEGVFVQTTLARTLYDLGLTSSEVNIDKTIETPYQLHRLTILNTVDHLADFAREKQPYFVFAHLVTPHPPYIFGPNGEELQHDQPFSLSGPGRQNGGPKYMKLYVDQLHFTDEIILKAVEKILAQSKTPPIIIIQGDHGPVSYFGEDEVLKGNMKEQHAILNAYYFPGGKYDLLYPSVSPVNSFRIVLNTYFDGKYELLPDKNYFIPHARPYDFMDVTDRVKTDPLKP
jgi:Sulfatase